MKPAFRPAAKRPPAWDAAEGYFATGMLGECEMCGEGLHVSEPQKR